MTADFGGLRMKHLNKIIALISALCLVIGMLSGCKGVEVEEKQYADYKVETEDLVNLENGIVAESEDFKMEWIKSDMDEYGTENYRAIINFISKKDGAVWSTTPKEYYDKTDPASLYGNDLINSSLVITTLTSLESGAQVFAHNAYDKCIVDGRFSSAKLDDGRNGMRITYYFDAVGAIVSVDYYLEDGGFKVSVDPKNVNSYVPEPTEEDDKSMHNKIEGLQRIVSVTPAPYMCSTQNTEANDKSSYFVIPSGSGALMYVDQRQYGDLDGAARTFGDPDFILPHDTWGMVYGEDYSVEKYLEIANETPITMPFYGIRKGTNALCAIIENAAEACKISAKAGGPDTGVGMFDDIGGKGYSYLAASYSLVGYNKVYNTGNWRVHYNEYVEQNLEPLVIGYYPLSGKEANYSGIAKRYQKYLEEKEQLVKSQDNSLLNVKFYGSYVKDELFAGIPYEDEKPLTTYSDATKILGELKKISGGNLTAVMQGYGEGGINANEIAGGLTLESAAGDEDDLKKFVKYTKNEQIPTFFSFDTARYSESGNGYSIKDEAAYNNNGIPVSIYDYIVSTHNRFDRKEGGKVSTLIARDQLDNVARDAVSLLDQYGISGIAFDTLGNMCYSDYDTVGDNDTLYQYPLRNNMGKDVKKIAEDASKKSKTILMDGAFAYAAVASDIITNAPTSSAKVNAFDLEVPLYQMVFQGLRANCTGAINIANNRRTQFLKAIETGSGLSFELTNAYDRELRKQFIPGLHATYYEDNKQFIIDCVNESKEFLTSVAGKKITEHRYVAKDVTRTIFENGKVVFVNYNKTDVKVGNEIIKAESFLAK